MQAFCTWSSFYDRPLSHISYLPVCSTVGSTAFCALQANFMSSVSLDLYSNGLAILSRVPTSQQHFQKRLHKSFQKMDKGKLRLLAMNQSTPTDKHLLGLLAHHGINIIKLLKVQSLKIVFVTNFHDKFQRK